MKGVYCLVVIQPAMYNKAHTFYNNNVPALSICFRQLMKEGK